MPVKLFDYYTQYTSPNQSAGFSAESITIHWWGVPGNHRSGKIGGVVNWLCQERARASAHFVTSGLTAQMACLINLSRRAWHSANSVGNRTSVGIEMHPWDANTPASQINADLNAAAYNVALIWKWRPRTRNKALKGHKDWFSTACPGTYYAVLGEIFRRAKILYPFVLSQKPGWLADGAPINKLTDKIGSPSSGAPTENEEDDEMKQEDFERMRDIFIREMDAALARHDNNLVPRPDSSDSKDPEWSLGNSVKYLLDGVQILRGNHTPQVPAEPDET